MITKIHLSNPVQFHATWHQQQARQRHCTDNGSDQSSVILASLIMNGSEHLINQNQYHPQLWQILHLSSSSLAPTIMSAFANLSWSPCDVLRQPSRLD